MDKVKIINDKVQNINGYSGLGTSVIFNQCYHLTKYCKKYTDSRNNMDEIK